MKGYSRKYYCDVFRYETEENSDFTLFYQNEKDIYYFHDFINLVKDIDTISPVVFLQKLSEIKAITIAHTCIFPPKNWVKKKDIISLLDYWESSLTIPQFIDIGGHNPPLLFDISKKYTVRGFVTDLILSYKEETLPTFYEFAHKKKGLLFFTEGLEKEEFKIYVMEWLNMLGIY